MLSQFRLRATEINVKTFDSSYAEGAEVEVGIFLPQHVVSNVISPKIIEVPNWL